MPIETQQPKAAMAPMLHWLDSTVACCETVGDKYGFLRLSNNRFTDMITQENLGIRSFRVLTGAFLITWLILPLIPLAIWSFAKGWFHPDLLPRNWSMRAWEYAMSDTSGVLASLWLTIWISLVANLAIQRVDCPFDLLSPHIQFGIQFCHHRCLKVGQYTATVQCQLQTRRSPARAPARKLLLLWPTSPKSKW